MGGRFAPEKVAGFVRISHGIPDFLIQAYIGHSSTAMTDHYTHIRDEDFQPIIDAQERLLANRKAG